MQDLWIQQPFSICNYVTNGKDAKPYTIFELVTICILDASASHDNADGGPVGITAWKFCMDDTNSVTCTEYPDSGNGIDFYDFWSLGGCMIEDDWGEGTATFCGDYVGEHYVSLNVWDEEDNISNNFQSDKITVVEVDNIVAHAYEWVGESTEAWLVAVQRPRQADWPTGQPQWEIVSQPAGASATLEPSPPGYPRDVALLTGMTRAGEYVIMATCEASDLADPGDNTVTITAVSVEMENPAGDPTDSYEAEDGVNEFTFGSGYCYVECKASVEPDEVGPKAWVADKIEWSISPGISGSEMSWGYMSGGTFIEDDNKGVEVWIEFDGLPGDNDQFGTKTVKMTANGQEWTNDIQVFFQKEATDNPGGSVPNWFYYWNQTEIGNSDAVYETGEGWPLPNGQVPAMACWAPDMTYSKTLIQILDGAAGGGSVSGIDKFANVIKHEGVHVDQISIADALLGGLNGTAGSIWEKGWSWGTYSPNNHWTLGPDGKPGKPDFNDDDDEETDEISDNSEIGAVDGNDVDLDDDDDNVPNSKESESPAWVEPAAEAAETYNNKDCLELDWGNPGKNHYDYDYDS